MAKGRKFYEKKICNTFISRSVCFYRLCINKYIANSFSIKKETMAASSTDYTMDDFGKLLSETEKLFSEETKDFSKDQLYTQEA